MIDNLKFGLLSIVVIVLVGLLGYWAIHSIQSGTEFKASQKVQQLEKENADLTRQVADLTDKLDLSQSANPEPTASSTTTTVAKTATTPTTPTTKTTTYKYQSLINQLQRLITNQTVMKLKSASTSVGTIQNFLNLYNHTSNKIDNDYGVSTQTAVSAFQKDQGLSVTGQTGPTTYSKMIDWLKKQG